MRIYGHRGARGEKAENTLSGFRHAIALGCDGIELDLQLSADGRLMVIHDPTLERTTNGHGRVSDMDSAQLGALDAGDGDGVITIDALLDACPELNYVQLETKPVDAADVATVGQALLNLFATRTLDTIATVTSFDRRLLAWLHEHAPAIALGYVCETAGENPFEFALTINAKIVALDHNLISADHPSQARDNGMELSVWTVNQPEAALQLASMGVDSIITDVPTLMLSVFGRP